MAISLAITAGSCVVVKHPDGSFDVTAKSVRKARELPEQVVEAANLILSWAQTKSAVIVAGDDGRVDRVETIVRVK